MFNKQVNEEYEKKTGKTQVKKYFKGLFGKETDEYEERKKIEQKIISKWPKEKKKLLKEQLRAEKRKQYLDSKGGTPVFDIAKNFLSSQNGTCRCQVLRSSCIWSTGIRRPEDSILRAYVQNIDCAEKFIYIENQFFMSNAGTHEGVVRNGITRALKDRIIRAHRKKENFRVYILIPLLPGFEGDIMDDASQVLKLQVRFQQETISKGPNSLFTMLKEAGVNPSKYIRFYGLRNHDVFKDGPKQMMIYIHSKCMIVDDRLLIVGSANINDRSMLGTRDSEVCVLVQDDDKIESTMGGEPFQVSKVVHEFRKQLMMGKYPKIVLYK